MDDQRAKGTMNRRQFFVVAPCCCTQDGVPIFPVAGLSQCRDILLQCRNILLQLRAIKLNKMQEHQIDMIDWGCVSSLGHCSIWLFHGAFLYL